jgi:hypothetical protein
MLLEATRQNYATAREYSTQYFDRLRELTEKANDAPLKAALMELLNTRDSITGALAQGNPSIVSELQLLLERTDNVPDVVSVPR